MICQGGDSMNSEQITKELPGGGSFTYQFIHVERLEAACERARQEHWKRMKMMSDQGRSFLEGYSKK